MSTRADNLAAGQRVVVLALSALTPLVIWPWAFDAMELPKWTLVVLGGGLLALLAVARTVAEGRLQLQVRGPQLAAVLFLTAAVVSVAGSTSPVLSLFGEYGRFGGLWLYAALVVIVLTIAAVGEERLVAAVAYAFTAGAVGVVLAGLAQMVGLDPTFAQSVYGENVYATLGNPNFASGFLGATLPLLVWSAMTRDEVWIRWPLAAVALLALVVIVATNSYQGLLAAAAALAVFAVGFIRGRNLRRQRALYAGLAGAGVVGAVLLAAGLLSRGPLSFLGQSVGVALRRVYMGAAWDMGVANPITGVGLDRYGAFFRAFRSDEGVRAVDVTITSNAAHNVPLHFFAGGGLLLALAYLAFVALVAVALVRGLRSRTGADAVLLGAVGGAWVGYQVQSMVSIDAAALALLGWASAGAVLALSPAPVRFSLTRGVGAQQGKKAAARSAQRRQRYAMAVSGVLALVLTWMVLLPLRADVAAGAGRAALDAGAADQAIPPLQRAVERAPWMPEYHYRLGRAQAAAGDLTGAISSFERAENLAGGDLPAALAAAETAVALGRDDVATRWYERALEIEPRHPQLLVMAAQYFASAGDDARARALAQRALEVDPDNAEALELQAGPAVGQRPAAQPSPSTSVASRGS